MSVKKAIAKLRLEFIKSDKGSKRFQYPDPEYKELSKIKVADYKKGNYPKGLKINFAISTNPETVYSVDLTSEEIKLALKGKASLSQTKTQWLLNVTDPYLQTTVPTTQK